MVIDLEGADDTFALDDDHAVGVNDEVVDLRCVVLMLEPQIIKYVDMRLGLKGSFEVEGKLYLGAVPRFTPLVR